MMRSVSISAASRWTTSNGSAARRSTGRTPLQHRHVQCHRKASWQAFAVTGFWALCVGNAASDVLASSRW